MDLVRAWATAVAVFVVGSLVTVTLAIQAASPDALTGSPSTLVWNAGPSLVIYLCMTALSAVAHPVP